MRLRKLQRFHRANSHAQIYARTHLEILICLPTQFGYVGSGENMYLPTASQQISDRHLSKYGRYFPFIVYAAAKEVVDTAHQIHVRGRRHHEWGCAQERLHRNLHREFFSSFSVETVFGEQRQRLAERGGEL